MCDCPPTGEPPQGAVFPVLSPERLPSIWRALITGLGFPLDGDPFYVFNGSHSDGLLLGFLFKRQSLNDPCSSWPDAASYFVRFNRGPALVLFEKLFEMEGIPKDIRPQCPKNCKCAALCSRFLNMAKKPQMCGRFLNHVYVCRICTFRCPVDSVFPLLGRGISVGRRAKSVT